MDKEIYIIKELYKLRDKIKSEIKDLEEYKCEPNIMSNINFLSEIINNIEKITNL